MHTKEIPIHVMVPLQQIISMNPSIRKSTHYLNLTMMQVCESPLTPPTCRTKIISLLHLGHFQHQWISPCGLRSSHFLFSRTVIFRAIPQSSRRSITEKLLYLGRFQDQMLLNRENRTLWSLPDSVFHFWRILRSHSLFCLFFIKKDLSAILLQIKFNNYKT